MHLPALVLLRTLLIPWVGAAALLAAPWTAARAQEPDEYILTLPSGPAAPAQGGSVRFIGNATVLIEYQGLAILTDPNFLPRGSFVRLGYGLRSERLAGPAIGIDALPPVDLVVLTHLHEDHFDWLVQQRLRRDVPIVTTSEAAPQLEELGFTQHYGLAAWDSLTVRKGEARLRITALPARHGPRALAWLLPEVMGALLDFGPGAFGPGYRMYISGDTVLFDELAQIGQRFPDIDLALLHLGGMRLVGPFKLSMDGEDGARLLQLTGARRAIPLHFSDYDMFRSPLSDFQRATRAPGLDGRVIYLERGDTYTLPLERTEGQTGQSAWSGYSHFEMKNGNKSAVFISDIHFLKIMN